ncbi:formyl-CoA transferase [Tamaricihabitans halophyticus]|uniref:Formyl-CoA transferase n=1 Tax=Tamaricihabitans halophyticus TaxID=1262583 RepID=A0A4R2QXP1_9PSEU|nr:CoA transferase [Tamaricihabitans halophyticus]TCP51861.1 formyl-CoA transferase [Tamaricihabitans halophyticus]
MKPLDGIRVLDLSRVLAGPYCTQFLGELGAEVIKVEPPGEGDQTRSWGPPFLDGGEAVYFMATNRNKRGVVVDLKTDRGRQIIAELAERADVLVENFRPGTLERWGLDYATLSTRNPRLIHLAISGFGQTGRYRDRAGYDLIAQGMGGVMALTGEPDGRPVKVGFPVADLNGGTWGIIAVLMALQSRHRTGRGQYLDVSLLEAQLSWHIYAAGMHLQGVAGDSLRRFGSAHPMIAPYQAYPTADGWLNLAVGSQKLWHACCAATGLDIADDERFHDNPARVAHREELNALLEPVLRGKTTAQWLEVFEQAGIPAGPINEIADIYADDWVTEREQVVELPHPVAGTYRGTGFPIKASDTPAGPSAAPPVLGQDTRAVLAELGYPTAAIDELLADQIVAQAPTEQP